MIVNILKKNDLGRADIIALLSLKERSDIESLYAAAYEEKLRHTGRKVFFRGLIEFSNICVKDCYYCGIRRSNKNTNRFFSTIEEILEAANFAYEQGYGSIVLQSGEREDDEFVKFVENALLEIKKIGNGALGVTLSLGEQSEEVYKRWFDAGGHRYLLRIETTNRELYRKLHPADHSFDRRVECLNILKRLGYQVGTGVMTGLPGQTIEDLADDILFFKDKGVHMIGMGPFIPHHDTPLGGSIPDFENVKDEQLELGLKMIAVTRLVLKNVNIASTTALQALSETGRELGLKAGANIIMPSLTDRKYRADYLLYDNKPCVNESAGMCRGCLEMRIKSIGEEIGYNQWGDSLKFKEDK
ncbi:MAG TPA: [FeFe] hydrogenase H-cluster radical SAM maturase HydE [bacterium]|nr:[FeFe] hydrogenase H-cluster radical SAM maturase HydE [bacterium]HPS29379.1 [FeFe] hydrogenase H-cluster radical SAM maturase HydE [bacterium]